MQDAAATTPSSEAWSLARFILDHPKLAVLTGAGCSTRSGIPDYRDDAGNWRHRRPMQFSDFIGSARSRQRYWAQSFSGWQKFSMARPNVAHRSLAALEKLGYVQCLVTQNVDNLHRLAGSESVIDLHGALHQVRCLDCDRISDRTILQAMLVRENPGWCAETAAPAPDGDARITRTDFENFNVPACLACGGILKPDVVFFGETINAPVINEVRRAIVDSDALLVVGSSLMVFSGYRFARQACAGGKPLVILNRGRTRADELATTKLSGDCGDVLDQAVLLLSNGQAG